MSRQLAKSKKKPTKKQISESRKVFGGTDDPAQLDLLLHNRLTRKMKPFVQQIFSHELLDTGAITGQYHVVLDDWFHTVDATVQTNFKRSMNEAQPHDKILLFIGFIRTKWKHKQNLHRNVKHNNNVD